MSFAQTILDLLDLLKIEVKKGETTIFIWKDEKHYDCSGEYTGDIRILKVPSEILDVIVTQNNKEEIAVCCIGFGEKADYTDLSIVYYMELMI